MTVVEAADRPLAPARCPPRSPPRWPPGTPRPASTCVTGARWPRVEPGGLTLADDGSPSRPARSSSASAPGPRPAGSPAPASSSARTARRRRRAPAHLAARRVRGRRLRLLPVRAATARRLLVHHWDNALQGAADGRRQRRPTPAAATPAGLRPGAVLLVRAVRALRAVRRPPRRRRRLVWRGDPAGRRLVGAAGCATAPLVALLAVGRPRDLAQGRKLIEAAQRSTSAGLADPAVAGCRDCTAA